MTCCTRTTASNAASNAADVAKLQTQVTAAREREAEAKPEPAAAKPKAPGSSRARAFRKLTDAEKKKVSDHVAPLPRGEKKRVASKLRAYLALGMSWDEALAKLPKRDAAGRPSTAPAKPRKKTKRTPAAPVSRRFLDDEAAASDNEGYDPEGEMTAEDRAFIDDSGL